MRVDRETLATVLHVQLVKRAVIADEQPVIFLYRTDVPALVSTRVHGLAAIGDRLDLRKVWLDP